MTHTAVFMTWLTLMLAYLAAGALLIPFKHRHATSPARRTGTITCRTSCGGPSR